MKEQQHTTQENHHQREKEQEQRLFTRTSAARLPAQQWARLLRRGNDLLAMPPPLLEELARSVGNSSLIELLRQTGGPNPDICTPEMLTDQWPESEVNYIQTVPPKLFLWEGWPESGGERPQPTKPGSIRARG